MKITTSLWMNSYGKLICFQSTEMDTVVGSPVSRSMNETV